MFRLLKEALAAPERQPTGSSQSQKVQGTEPRSSTARHDRTVEEPGQQPGQDASELSDEDMLFQDTLEELSRRKLDSKEELELTIQVCASLLFSSVM
jgi:hypothetical protein